MLSCRRPHIVNIIITIDQALGDLYNGAVNAKSDNDDNTEAKGVAIANQWRVETDVPLFSAEIGVVTMLPWR